MLNFIILNKMSNSNHNMLHKIIRIIAGFRIRRHFTVREQRRVAPEKIFMNII